MKNSRLLLFLLPIAALLFWYLGKPPTPPEPAAAARPASSTLSTPSTKSTPSTPITQQTPSAPNEPRLNPVAPSVSEQNPAPTGDIELPAPKPIPATGNPDITPDQKIEALRHTFRTYASRFKGNPVGDNAEITAALAGKNPGTANYLADTPHGLNDQAQLCDGWGTPYFFHQLSGTEMEIRSAGPDQKMWTTDDLVTK